MPALDAKAVVESYLRGEGVKPMLIRLRQEGFRVSQSSIYSIIDAAGCRRTRSDAAELRPRRYTVRGDYFNDICDEHRAYWLGFIHADGCICTRRKSMHLKVVLGRADASHLEKLRLALGSMAPVKTVPGSGYSAGSHCVSFESHSTELCRGLLNFGMSRRGLQRLAPKIPNRLVRHYLRGLFDGDGGFIFQPLGGTKDCTLSNWGLNVCGSLSCVEMFAAYARQVTNTKAVVVPHRSGIYYFRVNGIRITHRLARGLYSNCSVALDRKLAAYNKLCQEVRHRRRSPAAQMSATVSFRCTPKFAYATSGPRSSGPAARRHS